MTFKDISKQLQSIRENTVVKKTAEEKQQEFNAMVALALADQDRRLLELSNGGTDNG